MSKSVSPTEAEATTLFGARSKTASMTGRALLAGVAIIIASCGGSSSDSAPSSSAADEAAVADSNEDVAAVRAALEENADEPIPFGDDALDCVAEKVAADADLTAQVLADDVVDDAALVRITTTCAPEALASMLTDDPMFASLTDEEALCVVEAMGNNPELLDELDEMAIAGEMFSCAPTVMASMFADETGLTEAEAECILGEVDDFGALSAIEDMDSDATDADAMAAMGDLFEIFIACDISLETLAELGGAGDLGGDESSNSVLPTDQFDIDASRASCTDRDNLACVELLSSSPSEDDERLALDSLAVGCATEDMWSCDLLFLYSPPGSDDHEFGATCGWRTDGSIAGGCERIDEFDPGELRSICADGDMDACAELVAISPVGSDDERLALDSLRAGCADGDMSGCDLLYMYSKSGSDDEEFGATCGERTDGSTMGGCENFIDEWFQMDEIRSNCADGDMDACSDLWLNSATGSDDERLALDSLRAGCADGDMFGCDLLFMYSPSGSDYVEFGATCGERTDGSTAGRCEQE